MNKENTLKAAEIMRRAAEGEIVQSRRSGAHELAADGHWAMSIKPLWDFRRWEYRILEFPDPPKGEQWHNPHKLNATQVGVHEGFRLLLESEEIPEISEVWDSGWEKSHWSGPNQIPAKKNVWTRRTKDTLPEKKPPSTPEEAFKQSGFDCGEDIWFKEDTFTSGWKAAIKFVNSQQKHQYNEG